MCCSRCCAAGAATGAAASLYLQVGQRESVTIQVLGTFVGTLEFQGSADGGDDETGDDQRIGPATFGALDDRHQERGEAAHLQGAAHGGLQRLHVQRRKARERAGR